jgi:hypothetical protein
MYLVYKCDFNHNNKELIGVAEDINRSCEFMAEYFDRPNFLLWMPYFSFKDKLDNKVLQTGMNSRTIPDLLEACRELFAPELIDDSIYDLEFLEEHCGYSVVEHENRLDKGEEHYL